MAGVTSITVPAPGTVHAGVFGMPVRTGRWAFVLAGMIMNICLGTVYAWSVFRTPVARFFSAAGKPVTATQTLYPFMIFLAVFTALMPITGRLVLRLHPRTISLVGSLLVGAGWILSSRAADIVFLDVTYGAVAGAG